MVKLGFKDYLGVVPKENGIEVQEIHGNESRYFLYTMIG